MIPEFLQPEKKRLLLFSGKGGVGKTTASSSAALHIAARYPARSILLVSTDPAHSLKDSFAGSELPANLRVLELDTQACLAEFKHENRKRLMAIASRGTFLDEDDINRFLELSLPGLDELIGFLEISRWIRENAYDLIVVDTAPTGHTLRLLGMPDFLRKWLEALDSLLAKSRYMRKLFHGSYQQDDLDRFIEGLDSDVVRMKKLLRDPHLCQFIPVMLAEVLSVEETLDMMRELNRLGIRISDVLVNRLYPDTQCSLCADMHHRQVRELSRLAGEELFARTCLWGIPLYPLEIRGKEGLLSFREGLFPIRLQDTENPGAASAIIPSPIAPRVDSPLVLPPENTSLLVFAGKGGVGKTTLACATALRLAQVYGGKKILLFSADPAHSLSDCLSMFIGAVPTPAGPGLWAMEVNAGTEFDSLKKQYQREVSQFLTDMMPNLDLAYDREVMERLMDLSPPGIDELMALTSVMDFLARGEFDMLVLDAAPTGHLIRLLELPEIIGDWLKVVFSLFLKYRNIFRLPQITGRLVQMSKDLKHLRSLVHDPVLATLFAVSILTEMSFSETTDLLAACTRLAIPVRGLFLNQATPDSQDPLCASVFRQESLVAERFADTFPDIRRATVYRHSDPRGSERLSTLGSMLFRSGSMTLPEASP